MCRENICVINHDKGCEYRCCRALGSEPLSWLRSDVAIDLICSEMITGDTPYIIYLGFGVGRGFFCCLFSPLFISVIINITGC